MSTIEKIAQSSAPEAAASAVPPIPFPIPHPIPTPTPAPTGLVPTELVGGIGAAIGCDFRKSANQLVFVEYSGKLSTYNLFPAATIQSQGTATIDGTYHFDLDAGVGSTTGEPHQPTWDLFWSQQTATLRSMEPDNTATLVNLGEVPFAGITASTLQNLSYASTPINGNADATNKLVTGDVFAVHTTGGNYAKVLVTSYGYNIQIQWVTYKLAAAYNVIGTGYNLPEDVKVAADNLHAYVLEESGDLVKVDLASANRAGAAVLATGLVNPQQMAIDETHGNAYVVEFDPAGHGNLYRFGLTPGSSKHSVLNTLHGATGLVLTNDLQSAYVSEQNAGGTGPTGTVTRVDLATGSRHLIVSGLVAPFHLTWADDTESALFVAERDPANRVSRIDLATNTSHVAVSGVAFRPSSVALSTPSEMLICCDAELEKVELAPFPETGPFFMGIGNIPYNKFTPAGLADTTVDPTWFYQVKDVPMGGSLPIMVNHLFATESGAAFFRVQVYADAALTSLRLTNLASITNEYNVGGLWNAVTTATVTIGGEPGFLPVHTLADLKNWYNQTLGVFLDSTALSNGLNTIFVEFVTATGVSLTPKVAGAGTTVLVDNNSCAATIALPTLGGNVANPTCGVLKYTGLATESVLMGFTATHPNNFANYSFSLSKGVNGLTPPSIGGPVPAPAIPVANTVVSTLLGGCAIAGFAEYVYVAATANNGFGSQTQYDASASIAFVLAP